MNEFNPQAPAAAVNPFEGHGGSYSFDPATGQTTLLARAGLDPATPADPTPATQPEAKQE